MLGGSWTVCVVRLADLNCSHRLAFSGRHLPDNTSTLRPFCLRVDEKWATATVHGGVESPMLNCVWGSTERCRPSKGEQSGGSPMRSGAGFIYIPSLVEDRRGLAREAQVVGWWPPSYSLPSSVGIFLA